MRQVGATGGWDAHIWPAGPRRRERPSGGCGTDETATELEKNGRRWPRGAGFGDLRRQPQMAQQARDHRGVFNHGDQPEASAAPWTREHVNPEAPAHQLRPETVGPPAPPRIERRETATRLVGPGPRDRGPD